MPRAIGRRMRFLDLPQKIHNWVASEFGDVGTVVDHVGGMSPGCASTVSTARAGEIFVKAVGPELNLRTPALFRQEIDVLTHLGQVPYRPTLLDSYDDGSWVGIALQNVPGRYPDLGSADDFEAVSHVVEAQSAELTPAPDAIIVPTLASTAQQWSDRWSHMVREAPRFLPAWVVDRFGEMRARVAGLPGQLDGQSLCHFDIRDDNLLIRDNGEAVILDWGMARLGPSWTDTMLLALQLPTAAQTLECLDHQIPHDDQDAVTSTLVAFGGSQAWNALQRPKPSLPTFTAFTRDDARRLFAVARLRVDRDLD